MAKINLLPWRDELRIKRNNEFVAYCVGALLLGMTAAGGSWFYYDQKLQDQEQANQLIISTNQNLDVQLKSLEGLQEQRNAIVERMKLIQGLQTQRPIAVHLIDEIVHVTPSDMYITKFNIKFWLKKGLKIGSLYLNIYTANILYDKLRSLPIQNIVSLVLEQT